MNSGELRQAPSSEPLFPAARLPISHLSIMLHYFQNKMKVVIVGGSGHVGQALQRHWKHQDIILVGRNSGIAWDGRTLGPWIDSLEGADVVVNLAGRSVNCRYTDANLKEMMDSRVESTRILGEAIAGCKEPPNLWLQASTATIYSHRFDAPNDEESGIIGGQEHDAPRTWKASIEIAKAWEETFHAAPAPNTRKVAMRSAMTMSPIRTSVFGVLFDLARRGLGGTQGDGRHYVSWVHETDFCRALDFLIEREDLAGPVNICSPNPIPQADFARILRESAGIKFAPGLPVWALEVGAWLRQTETELILKSRRVIPARLLEAGFKFEFPSWPEAAKNLVSKLADQSGAIC